MIIPNLMKGIWSFASPIADLCPPIPITLRPFIGLSAYFDPNCRQYALYCSFEIMLLLLAAVSMRIPSNFFYWLGGMMLLLTL